MMRNWKNTSLDIHRRSPVYVSVCLLAVVVVVMDCLPPHVQQEYESRIEISSVWKIKGRSGSCEDLPIELGSGLILCAHAIVYIRHYDCDPIFSVCLSFYARQHFTPICQIQINFSPSTRAYIPPFSNRIITRFFIVDLIRKVSFANFKWMCK